jgi:hypothetical protein
LPARVTVVAKAADRVAAITVVVKAVPRVIRDTVADRARAAVIRVVAVNKVTVRAVRDTALMDQVPDAVDMVMARAARVMDAVVKVRAWVRVKA